MVSIVKGVGINDADYRLNVWENLGRGADGKQVQKLVWRCPYYIKWMSLLDRCYSEKSLIKFPTYNDAVVCEDWLTFSNFKAWMETQDHEGKQLDKDILLPRNKLYSPETCVFVSELTNKFIEEGKPNVSGYPLGVSAIKGSGGIIYRSYCQQLGRSPRKNLGYFNSVEEAHFVWLTEKRKLATIVAEMQADERVAKALVDRYDNLSKWSDRTLKIFDKGERNDLHKTVDTEEHFS